MTGSKLKALFLGIFEYYTPKIVLIKNIKVGVLNRLVQLLIFSYIIGYAIIWNKGYQDFSIIESAVTTKLKGVIYSNFSDDEFNGDIPDKEIYRRIWDAADYVVPPSENNAFFVITNVVITGKQTQSKCPEDFTVPSAICKVNSDCPVGSSLTTGNGVLTGECVPSDRNESVSVCQVQAWCPVERDINPLKGNKALLTATKNFTVLIKNFVDFPKFQIRRRNIPNVKNDSYLKNCVYHPNLHPLCPIFKLEDIVPGDYDELAVKGAAIAIVINWDCNFDFDASSCYPTYSFRRLDENAKIAPGLNFRFAHYYSYDQRSLFKAYGLKFIVMAQGRGGKFSVVPLLLNLGSGLGLLAAATVLCDIVVLHIVNKKDIYKSFKYESVAELENAAADSYSKHIPFENCETAHLKSSIK